MSKRVYEIRMPFTGLAYREIEAESEEQALEIFNNDSTFPVFKTTAESDVEIMKIEMTDQIVRGNVFYGVQNQLEIEDLGEACE